MLRRTDSPPSRQELLALAGFLEEALSHIEAGEKQAVRHYAELERRLLDIENSRFLRTLQWPGRFLGDWKGRLGQLLLHSPLHPLYLKLLNPHFTADRYRLWVESEQVPGERRRTREPLISLILPVHNPRRDWLEAAVASVLDQTYGCWQLCVCDDASEQDWVVEHFTALMSTGLDPADVAAIRSLNSLPHEQVRAARILSYASQEVTIDAAVERPALLVLNDSDYPGWKVYVDGRRSHWITTNYLFRGVLLQPGRHLVQFAYEPASFAAGAAISGAGLICLAWFALWRRRRPDSGVAEAHLV